MPNFISMCQKKLYAKYACPKTHPLPPFSFSASRASLTSFPCVTQICMPNMCVPKPTSTIFLLCASRASLILFPCVTRIRSPICDAFGFLKLSHPHPLFPSFVPPGHAQFYVHVSQKIGSQICSGLGILIHPPIHSPHPVWSNQRASHSFSCNTLENFHSVF